MRLHAIYLLLILGLFFSLQAQTTKSGSIAIIPFYVNGIDQRTISTSEELLRMEMEKVSLKNVSLLKNESLKSFDPNCTSEECAAAVGKEVNADQVVACQVLRLGQKLIVQYFLIDVPTKKIVVADKLTSTSIEDLDVVMKRIALSVTQQESAEKAAQVGAITANETKPFFLRSGRRFNNWSFGYLYPQKGYSTGDRSFTMDLKLGSESEDFDYGVQFFIREGFGANIFSSYLFTKKDICPYVGAGVGFHWVTIDNGTSFNQPLLVDPNKDKKGDGFEVLVNAGLKLFHTYNFGVNLNVSYARTFNDLKSEGVIVTIGFMY